MGPAGRTTLEFLVLSDSLRPGFSVRDTGDGSGRPRTLYFVRVVRNFVCAFHDFVRVLLNSVCGLHNFAYVAHNRRIGFRRIWVDDSST